VIVSGLLSKSFFIRGIQHLVAANNRIGQLREDFDDQAGFAEGLLCNLTLQE
jgi:hypothetical protein